MSSADRQILDPTSERQLPSRNAPPRPTSTPGLTIGLLDISKARGDVYLERLAGLLSARGAEVKRYRKPTFAKPASMELRQQIAAECDAFIEALAD